MPKDETEIEEAFQEPLNAFTSWLSSDIESLEAQQRAVVEEGIVADILGEKSASISRKPSRLDELRGQFGYALMSLLSSFHRIERIKKLLRHFPRKDSGVSKSEHLENCTVLLFNEIYVLEERLKAYLNECKAIDTKLRGSSDIRPGQVSRIYHRAFKGFLAARGGHTHRRDFEDDKVKRIGLIDLLMTSEHFGFLRPTLRQAIKEARDHWLQKVEEVEAAARQILTLAFEQTRPLYRGLFPAAVEKRG